MYHAVKKLEQANLIYQSEASEALEAQALGTSRYTIGFELEVLPSAENDIQKKTAYYEYGYSGKELVEDEVAPYKFEVGSEGLYELQSPPARHPLALAIAVRGIARLGWLPERTKGRITSHISIGTARELPYIENQLSGFIGLLRAVELNGNTTPARLMKPATKAVKYNDDCPNEYCWNQKGISGVNINRARTAFSESNWVGRNHRVELRTLGYYSPEQFERSLNAVYFLGRGLLARSGSVPAKRYSEYADWFSNYQATHGLSKRIASLDELTIFNDYMRPYADHLANADLAELRSRTEATITDLREEFGMNISNVVKVPQYVH